MNPNSLPFRILHPTLEDFSRVIAFMIATDVAEFGEPDTDEGDTADQWNQSDLNKDIWLAVDEADAICGYALFSDNGERGYSFDLYAYPTELGNQIKAALLDEVLKRVKSLATEKKTVTTYVSGFNPTACRLIESRGFKKHTVHYRMQIDFADPVEAPVCPEGYTLHAVTQQDEPELYELISSAFDWPGRTPVSFDTWKELVFRNGRYDPELFLLVRKEGKLVGAALCYDEITRGWVKQLAVAKETQGQGLGALLLKQVFSIFSFNGRPTVALGVSSANEKATLFYERAGMRRSREFVEYHLEVG
jgi:ribosomal protein S18 acetylase RimI-like enzyme